MRAFLYDVTAAMINLAVGIGQLTVGAVATLAGCISVIGVLILLAILGVSCLPFAVGLLAVLGGG